MTPRQEQLLGAIIKEYTKTAEPVSSSLLCDKSDLSVSSATVRAEMVDLEKMGYLEQPHTSAGRIPTDKAYRYFVDNLLETRKNLLTPKEKDYIKTNLKGEDPHLVSRGVAKVIADISDNFALSGIVDTGEFYKFGFSSFLEFPEFQELESFRRISSVFDEFEMYIDKIFNQLFESGQSIFIGNESPIRDIREETMITAAYSLPQGYSGVAAMIGPLRMKYDKNIALMKYVTQILSR